MNGNCSVIVGIDVILNEGGDLGWWEVKNLVDINNKCIITEEILRSQAPSE